jgi:hypothetical protein
MLLKAFCLACIITLHFALSAVTGDGGVSEENISY